MATDLLAMQTEMQNNGFSDTAASQLTAFINDAYYDVCSRYPWPFLEAETTVTLGVGDTTPASAPADLRAVIALVDDTVTWRSLTPERWDYLIKRYAGALTTQGQPVYYYFVGETLRTFPPADSAYTLTLKYLKFPTGLSVSTDVPLIPERHRRVITLGAMVSAYRQEDDPELGAIYAQQFEQRIQTMVEDLTAKQYDRPERMFDLYLGDDFD